MGEGNLRSEDHDPAKQPTPRRVPDPPHGRLDPLVLPAVGAAIVLIGPALTAPAWVITPTMNPSPFKETFSGEFPVSGTTPDHFEAQACPASNVHLPGTLFTSYSLHQHSRLVKMTKVTPGTPWMAS